MTSGKSKPLLILIFPIPGFLFSCKDRQVLSTGRNLTSRVNWDRIIGQMKFGMEIGFIFYSFIDGMSWAESFKSIVAYREATKKTVKPWSFSSTQGIPYFHLDKIK